MNSDAPPKIILSTGRSPYQRRKHKTWEIGHLVAATEKPAEQQNKPCPAASPRHGKTNQTCETSWRIKQGKQDRSMDRADAQHVMIFSPDTTNPAGPNTTNTALPSCVMT